METGGGGPIFRASLSRRRLVSPGVWRVLLRRLRTDATVHGFCSSFRDWCGETGVPRKVAEACLAHKIRNRRRRRTPGPIFSNVAGKSWRRGPSTA